MRGRCLLFTGALLFVLGCSTVHQPESQIKSETSTLTQALEKLSPRVDRAEAARAANVAIRYPLELAREYHAISPAGFNNLLINVGIHSRGLCYQWADDLTAKMMTLDLRTLKLHRGVARLGSWREHSCVVLTAPNQDFTNGLVLDAWRHAGRLYWSPVATDKYAWKEVVLSPDYMAELHAAARKIEHSSK